jgi:hypothetical protein
MASYDSIERICIFNSAYRLHTISFCRDDNETKVAIDRSQSGLLRALSSGIGYGAVGETIYLQFINKEISSTRGLQIAG